MSGKYVEQFRAFFLKIGRAGMIVCLFGSLSGLPVSQAKAAGGPPLPPVPSQSAVGIGSLSGLFSILWGDGPMGGSQSRYTLTDNQGNPTYLQLDQALVQSQGGALSFNHKYVTVEGIEGARRAGVGKGNILNVTSIYLAAPMGTLNAAAYSDVTGSRPWVSILCKFNDHPEEPHTLAFFQGMYASTKPGLDDYWRELSYNTANVNGSGAFGWFTLPQPESYYNPSDTGQGSDLGLLLNDCTHAADASVDFSLYSGINMMFNTDFDNGWAWGGGWNMTLDGVNRLWSTTWEPPWGYANISVIAHEMGHGFGLPHSSGNYGEVYDNAWDVMSEDRYNCGSATDPTYGCMAQHTIAYHLDLVGWIPPAEKYTAGLGTDATITLEQLALPQTTNYKMAKIPIGGSSTHFYTVEARRKVGYDIKLAGDAIVIHDVDLTRDIPAHVIDIDNNGDTSDPGARWTVGETFSDPAHGISVTVSSATATGFQVRIITPQYVDSTPPVVTDFTATTPINSLNIPITSFTATDDVSVTGYLITESSAVPSASRPGWSGSKPNTYTVASAGSHTLYPWAKDHVGHVSAVFGNPRTVLVDLTPPDTTLAGHPANPTNQTSAAFTFSGTDGSDTFECFLDSGDYTTCSSGKSYSGLIEGSHTFRVRARDLAGNVDPTPASVTWEIDTTAPDTRIDSHPVNPTALTVADFTFSSPDETAEFECLLDSDAYTSCASGKSYSGLTAGPHTFQVWAKDPAGNIDATPDSYTWVIDLTPPSVISSLHSGTDPADSAHTYFAVTFSEPVTGVGIEDFFLAFTNVTGASVTDVSGSGNAYTVTVDTGTVDTGKNTGSIRLDVPSTATVMDLAGNALTGLPYQSGQDYTLRRDYIFFLPFIGR